jgi:hypothetical protein
MLFPTRQAAINLCGFFMKKESTLAGKKPSLLSNSTRNLLEVRNAISIPEKNAEDKTDNKMMLTGFTAMLD